MRKFITAIFFLAAGYLAVYAGDYSYAYVTNSVTGWGVAEFKNLHAGPGWLGGVAVALGLIGVISSAVLIERTADKNEEVSELSFVPHGLGFLLAAYAFGVLAGPFEAWGRSPVDWLQSRLAVFAVLCAWALFWEGFLALLSAAKTAAEKGNLAPGSNVTQLKPGQKSA